MEMEVFPSKLCEQIHNKRFKILDYYRTFKMKNKRTILKNIIRYVPLEYTESIGRHWIKVKIVALK